MFDQICNVPLQQTFAEDFLWRQIIQLPRQVLDIPIRVTWASGVEGSETPRCQVAYSLLSNASVGRGVSFVSLSGAREADRQTILRLDADYPAMRMHVSCYLPGRRGRCSQWVQAPARFVTCGDHIR